MHVDTRRKEATNNFPLSAGDWYRQSQQPQWQLERHQNAERGGKMGEDAYEASPSLFSLTFSRALQSASRDFSSNSPTQKARTLPVMDCHLIAAVDSFTHSGWRDGGRGEEEKRRRIFFFFIFFLRETCALTPVLRSGYPPCAAVSLVVLSPTREGRVCDIQLVIIAMVLSTTPIFSKGTDIFSSALLF